MSGIFIKNCKDIKLTNNYIDVDGTAVMVEESEGIQAHGNTIISKGNLTNLDIAELKKIVANLSDINSETKEMVTNSIEELNGQNQQTQVSGLRKIINLLEPIGQGLIVEYLKTKLGFV